MKPSETRDLYERLGVSRIASEQELKTAYRTLALQWHPDRNPERVRESQIEFIAISEAYKTLTENSADRDKLPTQDNSYESYNKFYQDFLRTVGEVSPELATAIHLFCGSSTSPAMHVMFEQIFNRN